METFGVMKIYRCGIFTDEINAGKRFTKTRGVQLKKNLPHHFIYKALKTVLTDVLVHFLQIWKKRKGLN